MDEEIIKKMRRKIILAREKIKKSKQDILDAETDLNTLEELLKFYENLKLTDTQEAQDDPTD